MLAAILTGAIAFGARQNPPADLPEGQGKKIVESACNACHEWTKVVTVEGLSKEKWRSLLSDMVRLGADLKDDQADVLAEYLAENFGEGKKVLDTVCTTCHELAEIKKFKGFYKREDWQDVVTTMVKYGAAVKENQVPLLVDYLTRTYSKGN